MINYLEIEGKSIPPYHLQKAFLYFKTNHSLSKNELAEKKIIQCEISRPG